MSNYSGKESQYRYGLASRKPVRIRQSGRAGIWGVTSWYQSLGLGVSGKCLRFLMHLHRMCWPNADVFVLFIVLNGSTSRSC